MTIMLTEKPADTLAQDDAKLDCLIEQKRYEVLKTLLLKEEDYRLGQLESYFANPTLHAEKIALALPKAIKQTDAAELYDSLNDCIQTCTAEFVQKNPALYAEVLYPVIFPAIKKSITEALKEIMQSVNYAIDQGLSLNRFIWHYESWRSGIPYREIVLRHTLAYRVEQAFLIHRETGLLLRHVALSDVNELRDSDAVSAMLTAIQDFIKDSFSVNSDDYLDMVEIGDYTVFLNRGTYAVLACVMQGIAPHSLREKFETILLDIHQHYGSLLKNFDGDNTPLEVMDTDLQACLLTERKQLTEADFSPKYAIGFAAIICAVFGYFSYDNWQLKHRAEAYLQQLQQNKSIIITQQSYQHGQLVLSGLYDPLLPHPDTLIEKSRLQSDEVNSQWQAYQSLVPDLATQRLKQILRPPESVNINVVNNRLIVSGSADPAWINKLNTLYKPILISGISEINRTHLKSYAYRIKQQLQIPDTVTFSFNNGELELQGSAPISWHKALAKNIAALNFVTHTQLDNLSITEVIQLQELSAKINDSSLYFLLNRSDLKEKELPKLLDLIAMLKEVLPLSEQLNKNVRLVITGYTDGIGTMEQNRELAEKRANVVLEYMKQQAVSIPTDLIPQLGKSGLKDSSQRKVSFTLLFNEEQKI